MGKNSVAKGAEYEAHIAQYLTENGVDIVTTNYRCRYGEIDIIASSQESLIFVEVKYRSANTFGRPEDYLTSAKQQKLIKAAHHFLCENQEYQNQPLRFDLITNENKEITWIRNAIDCESSWI
ncbi:YraN family protein [uncultured Umboniibacter sp.]|uniref:YraN family protein n=1 Tax=uncultured Umboniibacter sp. TaxID=1798917 RepID=UPI002615CF60|nr:YraN family protein [uncultured Umboniibacter sp.]